MAFQGALAFRSAEFIKGREGLNAHPLAGLKEARRIIEARRIDRNQSITKSPVISMR